jgi:hypothetical protein
LCGIWLALLLHRIKAIGETKEVSNMAWGIMMTVLMLFGMLGVAIFEVTTVRALSTRPDVESDAAKEEVKKAA